MLGRIRLSHCIKICRDENRKFDLESLTERFSHVNPLYHRNERLGFSNYGTPRNICLADVRPDGLTLPRGLVSTLLKHYPKIQIIDRTVLSPERFRPSRILLKDYQEEALAALLRKNQGILVSPPGSGKTILGIELMVHRGQKALVLCHTIDLVRQWVSRFEQFTDIKPGIIQGDTYEIRDITIGTVQSLTRPLDHSFTRQFGMVLLDECHHVPAATFQQLVDQFPACYRYGLTATPEREDGLGFIITAVLGPIIHQVEKDTLVANGSILKPTVKVVQTRTYIPFVESYQELLAKIVKDEARNRLIVSYVLKETAAGHYCLVLSERVRHARELYLRFMEQAPEISAYCITGQDSKETRQKAINAMNAGTGRVLLSTKLADEGLDIPRIDRLFLTCPVRAVNKVTQQIGRIQRTFPGKRDAIVYDFIDNNSLAESQFRTRNRRIYSDYLTEIIERPEP